jgi:hypothetical protein
MRGENAGVRTRSSSRMSCPPEIAAILLELLRDGLLACRAAGGSGDCAACAEIADHLHNVPGMLARYTPEELLHYWDVMRPGFAARCGAAERAAWEQHWARLRPHAEAAAELLGIQ